MKKIFSSKVSLLCLCAMVFATFQFMSTDANARSDYYNSFGCIECHTATTTCNGCHAHGTHSSSSKTDMNVTATIPKTTYAPGETVTVTISGGYRSGWVRAALFNDGGTEIARSSGNQSGYGGTATLPATLSYSAPTTPGTYSWKAGWYGNEVDTNSATFGTGWKADSSNPGHGYETVSIRSFTVVAPDADNDGVADNVDQCPNQPGPASNNGCPVDTDGDGVVDANDQCPNQPGPASNNGCPVDTDGDGVVDANDQCPNQPGPASNNGCPVDTDGDGVVDSNDQCPNTPANTAVDANGCAIPVDSDGDGVVDANDQCPNTPANTAVDANGCAVPADTDGDGVVDSNDQCPNTPANTAVDANGCAVPVDPGPVCTDVDQDGYAIEGGDCGPVDCDDDNPAINPGASEFCSDSIDNNCDGLTDGQDKSTCPALPTCTDADGDNFFAQADCNMVPDCNDNDNLTYPGAEELCGDQVDNDCDGAIDENCDLSNVGSGAELYQGMCANCHGELTASNVCGESAREIMEAILENEGGMSIFSQLTDTQIKEISEALSSCSSRSDDDTWGGDSDDDDTSNYKGHRGKSEEREKRWKRSNTRSHYDD